MTCNNSKKKDNCGKVTYSSCIIYEGILSKNSTIEEACISIEETTQDIYEQLDNIEEKIEVPLIESCIVFTEPKTLVTVIEQISNKICELEEMVINQQNIITILQNKVEELQESNCN